MSDESPDPIQPSELQAAQLAIRTGRPVPTGFARKLTRLVAELQHENQRLREIIAELQPEVEEEDEGEGETKIAGRSL